MIGYCIVGFELVLQYIVTPQSLPAEQLFFAWFDARNCNFWSNHSTMTIGSIGNQLQKCRNEILKMGSSLVGYNLDWKKKIKLFAYLDMENHGIALFHELAPSTFDLHSRHALIFFDVFAELQAPHKFWNKCPATPLAPQTAHWTCRKNLTC